MAEFKKSLEKISAEDFEIRFGVKIKPWHMKSTQKYVQWLESKEGEMFVQKKKISDEKYKDIHKDIIRWELAKEYSYFAKR